ncbi:hypothetical protein B0H65DRAFT_583401, partial [Neurospora tetraspora]
MSSSELKSKRSPPSRSQSPRSGGHNPKRPKFNGDPVIDLTGDPEDDEDDQNTVMRLESSSKSNDHHVIDLTGDSDDDEINDMLHSIEEEAGELLAGLEATAMAVALPSAPSPAAPPLRSPSPELKAIEVVDLTGDSEDERERSPRSPTPSIDYRVALCAQETRDFVGTLVINPRPDAQFIAERACTSPLWVNNVPQIIIFCDGSSRVTPLMAWEGTNGGYGVVLRNPWAAAAANNQDGNGSVSGFEVRSWSHHKTYSSAEAEMAAIAQSLDTSVGLMGQHRPPTAEVQIFTDSMECWDRITRGLNHRQDRFSFRHTEPILRAIVWLSHRLKIMGGKLTVRWNPRRCAIGPELADDAAGVHSRGVNPEGFNQRNVPFFRRDGILNMLNEQIGAVVRERRTPAP